MNSYKAVTVHGLVQATTVLRCALPVTLLSARGAALAGGCLWWRELIEAARAEVPDTPCDDILDCADAPGRAMAALRVGQKALILAADHPSFAAVAAAARTVGAQVLQQRPVSFDPGPRDLISAYGVSKLRQWLDTA
jgi:hypothetical protein